MAGILEFVVSGATLGEEQTLTVSRSDTTVEYGVSYTCGDVSAVLCDATTEDTVTFALPVELASQNTTGEYVNVTLTVTDSDGDRLDQVVSMFIPATALPSCTLNIVDGNGYADLYGGFYTGLSNLVVDVNYVGAYGADIVSRTITVTMPGTPAVPVQNYQWSWVPRDLSQRCLIPMHFETDVLQHAGTVNITVVLTDSRGRSNTVVEPVTVLAYTAPVVPALTVKRCLEDGTEMVQGEYVQATFSATVVPLNGQNTASYILSYKKSTDDEWTDVALDGLQDFVTVENFSYIFPASSGDPYDVRVTVTDIYHTTTKTTKASTGVALIHFGPSGRAIAFGKVSEREDAVEFGWDVYVEGYVHSYNLTWAVVNETTYDELASAIEAGTLVGAYVLNGTARKYYRLLSYAPDEGTAVFMYSDNDGWVCSADGWTETHGVLDTPIITLEEE